MTFFLIYLLATNLIAFGAMGLDKRFARRQQNRIPESVLLTLSFIGGSLGAWLGMLIFRHKTKHRKFTLLLPSFLLMHILLTLLLTDLLPF